MLGDVSCQGSAASLGHARMMLGSSYDQENACSIHPTDDDLYRLTGQLKPGQVATYTLDRVGNLKTMWEGGSFPKAFTFDAADQISAMTEGSNVTTYGRTKYGFLASETFSGKTITYSYSGQDQLVGVTDPSGEKSTYTFDGDGLRRTAQQGNVQPTTMVWDGSDYLLLRGPTSDQVVLSLESEIVHCGGKDLLTDPLGSLVKEISPGASLSSLFQFYPYGTPTPGPASRSSNPFRFVGAHGYYTDTTERDYVRARELYKKLGRWMQTDPLWPEESPFSYARSNPIWMIDPSGELPVCVIPCACAAACVIDMLAVCADWTGFASYRDCLEKVYDELPGWLKFLCGVCIEGCIGCLVRNAKPPKGRPIEGGGPVRGGGPGRGGGGRGRGGGGGGGRGGPKGSCPRRNPGFPPGRWYQNCDSYKKGCNAMWSWRWDTSRDCLQCWWRCKSSGLASLLVGGCDFWNWR